MRSAACPTPTTTGVRGSTFMGHLSRRADAESHYRAAGNAIPRLLAGMRYRLFRISRAMLAVSDGVLPTRTPAASSASFFAAAVPDEPETIAPAWPIVLPSGAVKPAT